MLMIYRRHGDSCPHRKEGRGYRRCHCPIHVEGLLAGEEIRRSIGLRDWNKALELVREWESRGRASAAADPESVTIAQAWEQFLADAAARKLSESTVYKYELLKRQLEEFARQKGLRFLLELNVETLGKFRAGWTEGARTSLKKLERLRAFLGFAQERGWIATNPARKLKTPKISVRPTLSFTREEMLKILGALEAYGNRAGRAKAARLRAFVLLLRYSGMRIGDAVQLSTDRLTGDALFLYTQKTGVPVHMKIPGFVVQALEAAPRASDRYFFWTGHSELSNATSVWQQSLRTLGKLAGVIDCHAHRFRDTFAVELLLTGLPLERLSVLLGHQSIRITEKHYAPWVRSRQEQLERDLERAWSQDPIVRLNETKPAEVADKNERIQ